MLSTTTMLRLSPYASLYDEDGSYIQYPMDSDIKRGYNYWFSNQYNDLEKGYTIFNTVFNSRIKLPFNITYDFNIAPRYQFFMIAILCRLIIRIAMLEIAVLIVDGRKDLIGP